MKESMSMRLGKLDVAQALEEYLNRHMTHDNRMKVVSWHHPKQVSFGGAVDQDSIEVVTEPTAITPLSETEWPLKVGSPGDDGQFRGR